MIFINKTKWKLHYKTRTTPELLAYDRYRRTAEHSHMLESHMCLLPIGKIRNHSIYLCHVENRIKAEAWITSYFQPGNKRIIITVMQMCRM